MSFLFEMKQKFPVVFGSYGTTGYYGMGSGMMGYYGTGSGRRGGYYHMGPGGEAVTRWGQG